MSLLIDENAYHHSQKLTAYIQKKISESSGYIHFTEFMNLALYTPGLGYYSAGAHKLGSKGDFTTAPEISPLFAKCIANQCQQVFSHLKERDILELGAGSGIFIKDLLSELEKIDSLPDHYFILEVSADLRNRQKEFLVLNCPRFLNRIVWLDQLPASVTGIIFANEVIDAMPVHRFLIDNEGIKERNVTWKNNQFIWHDTLANSELKNKIEILSLSPYYESEINLNLSSWIFSLADRLNQGMILLIDYGYGQKEYYHPDRNQGTLMCFHQHTKHSDPFKNIGLQDITAHVDFTTVVESAIEAGLSLGGYTTQAGFLLSCGLLQIANQTSLSARHQYSQNQMIKKLTLPSQMGEVMKVMALTKGLSFPLLGFEFCDRRRDL